ncbi:hypothetical protein L6452_10398 [Arctium lappa]|uniref:Uncharacterized protein n=1 Tax=Arctium lappa TaxID=4217 RepID=A0ACB9DNH1_ARCLA|nr:hypothetical protein L6452_10398 [Arctium lappa]
MFWFIPNLAPFKKFILLKIHKRRLFAILRPSLTFSLWVFTFFSKIFPSLFLLSRLSILFVSALNSDSSDLFVALWFDQYG